MGVSRYLTATGLVLDLIGVWLLWKFGLPEAISRDGNQYLLLEQSDPEEIAKAKRYDAWATKALGFISLGFLLQFFGALL